MIVVSKSALASSHHVKLMIPHIVVINTITMCRNSWRISLSFFLSPPRKAKFVIKK